MEVGDNLFQNPNFTKKTRAEAIKNMINNLQRDETEVILALLDAKCSEDDHGISSQGDDEIGWRETMSKYEKYFGNVKITVTFCPKYTVYPIKVASSDGRKCLLKPVGKFGKKETLQDLEDSNLCLGLNGDNNEFAENCKLFTKDVVTL